jgi:hypothetical protein
MGKKDVFRARSGSFMVKKDVFGARSGSFRGENPSLLLKS